MICWCQHLSLTAVLTASRNMLCDWLGLLGCRSVFCVWLQRQPLDETGFQFPLKFARNELSTYLRIANISHQLLSFKLGDRHPKILYGGKGDQNPSSRRLHFLLKKNRLLVFWLWSWSLTPKTWLGIWACRSNVFLCFAGVTNYVLPTDIWDRSDRGISVSKESGPESTHSPEIGICRYWEANSLLLVLLPVGVLKLLLQRRS